MTLFFDLSLRWKIPLRVMGAVLGTALAVTVALLARDYEDMRQNLDTHAKSIGRLLASTLVAPVLHDDLWRAFEILQLSREAHPAAPELQAEVMLVLDAERRVFVASRPRDFPIGARPQDLGGDLESLITAISWGEDVEQQVVEPSGSSLYFVVSPLTADGERLGQVVLGYAKSALLPRYFDLVRRVAAVTLLVLIVLLPISWLWARRTGAPLLALSEAMRQVPEDLEVARLAKLPRSRDEIGQLGDAFRRMVGELKNKQDLESQMLVSERLAALGRLSAGIAHEINNPLGGMLTAIKTYQRHGGADPMANQTLALLERGISQIRNTVAALLVETRTEDRDFSPADVEDLLILIEAEAHLRSVAITVASPLTSTVPLPATLLRQILLNLLLNAITAAGEGGHVRVGLSAEDGLLRLSVCNDGQHIPDERMPYLFEPFSSSREKGHGLGLWIVYQIVQQLKGGIFVESEPGCTTFSIEIFYVESV
ncbi:HAMP domain-containing sensor histidine kinase [Magnetospirillum sp. SS-4]|uniref:sensor histidine kinase n=1 Tax=Magnetospirillum sp. SS-4 TaxID=2681465 RepID=UPI0013806836|nr:HAMP domain-containing sensor histidine kinase [Magnetospirillum sp. SS-4]CAA7616364.1 Sensor histidine kinase [Magnetospirillum sp. SS-4]